MHMKKITEKRRKKITLNHYVLEITDDGPVSVLQLSILRGKDDDTSVVFVIVERYLLACFSNCNP